VNSQSDKRKDLTALAAIKGVLKDHFAPYYPKIDLFFYGPESEAMVEKLLIGKPSEVSVRVIRLDPVLKTQLDFPSIFLFDSGEHFLEVDATIGWVSKNGVRHNHLIYAPKRGAVDIIEFLIQNNFSEENENIIKVVNDTTVDLVTSFFFLIEKCRLPHYKTINRFSTDTMRWENQTFFPEKYRNFHSCPLRVGYDSEKTKYIGREIFYIMAQQLNFNLVWVETPKLVDWRNVDVIEFMSFQDIVLYKKEFEFSSALFTDYLTFTVPAGEPYTQIEKMFLMFDKSTWICIGFTLGVGFLMVQLVNFMSVRVQNFVFGRNIRTPALNLINIFLNGAQTRVPGRNFARFMLILFVMWSLIIRTCYQSELYKNLQQDLRKPRIRTIDELNEQNFTLLYWQGDNESFEDIYIKRQVTLTRVKQI
jgi:hypothetical protein